MLSIKRILCPTDLSDCSKTALLFATSFAKQHDAEVHLVYVYEMLLAYAGDEETGVIPPADLDSSKSSLAAIALSDPTVRCHRKFIVGNPSLEIVNYAKDHSIDLIIMGTHGWSGVRRALMGSVAESIVRRAPCPVLTFKPSAVQLDATAVE